MVLLGGTSLNSTFMTCPIRDICVRCITSETLVYRAKGTLREASWQRYYSVVAWNHDLEHCMLASSAHHLEVRGKGITVLLRGITIWNTVCLRHQLTTWCVAALVN
jgi:hypothetical protein